MKKVIVINKKEGETPLQRLTFFRRTHKAYKDVPITYAGRLDPMASGLLVLLAGEETKNKEKYLELSKEYEFEVLFGFATDTYDILGKVTTHGGGDVTKKAIQNNLKHFSGKFIQKYPMYSSKAVNGKQLFEYARSGEEVEVPSREVVVKELKFLKLRRMSGGKLLKNIEKRIMKVNGDFRQEEILKTWKKNLETKNKDKFTVAKFKIKCSSGTYVRSIADELGKKVGIPALAFSIKRTKIGKWSRPN